MTQRLYRYTQNKKLAGVCAGLAEYFQIDVALIRVAFVLGVVLHGIGLLAYIVLWIAVPEYSSAMTNPLRTMNSISNDNDHARLKRQQRRGVLFAGLALIFTGLYFLLDNVIPSFDIENYSPVLLIALGISIVTYGYLNRHTPDQTQKENLPTESESTSSDSTTSEGAIS